MYEQFKDIFGLSPEENAPRHRGRLPRARLLQQRDHARRGARGAGATGARRPAGRGAAGPPLSQRSRRESRNPGRVPEARLPGVHAGLACRSTTTSSGACSGRKCESGEIPHPMAIDDVWKNSYSENTSRKVWAAKYTGAASQPGGAGAIELQVRPRRAYLHAWWKRSWSIPARRTSASRISTRTSPPARSGSAWRPSATS